MFENYKLKEIPLDKSKKHHADMYQALNHIENEMDSVCLSVGCFDRHSEFSGYDLRDMILDLDLARYYESYDEWCQKSPDPTKLNLKEVLRFHKIDFTDSDKKLIDIVEENDISLEDDLCEFSYLTDDGRKLLKQLEWIEIFVDSMDEFDFDDYYYFISDKSGTVKDNTILYLDAHLETAKSNKDGNYISACESSKTLVKYHRDNLREFTKSSSEVLKKFDGYVQKERELKKQEEESRRKNKPHIQMSEIDFSKLADNKYRLIPREDDCYVMPVRLKQFEYYNSVKKFNDADLALADLSFVPWCFRHALRDSSFKEGFITHRACRKNWKDFSKDLSTDDIREFLKMHSSSTKGSRNSLIEKIAESDLPVEEFSSQKTFLSKKGYDFLEEFQGIQFYLDNMSSFDYLDFEDYLELHSGSFDELTLDYLDEHLILAHESCDFDYIRRTYTAKSKIYHSIGDWEDALICDMRILHLNMNPICLENYRFSSHIPLVVENVSALKQLKAQLGEKRLFESFNENWNFLGFESTIIPKEEVWDYLTAALNSKDENFGSRKIREKYFINFIS